METGSLSLHRLVGIQKTAVIGSIKLPTTRRTTHSRWEELPGPRIKIGRLWHWSKGMGMYGKQLRKNWEARRINR